MDVALRFAVMPAPDLDVALMEDVVLQTRHVVGSFVVLLGRHVVVPRHVAALVTHVVVEGVATQIFLFAVGLIVLL